MLKIFVLGYKKKKKQTPMELTLNPTLLHMDAGSKAEEQWRAPPSASRKGMEVDLDKAYTII